MRSLILILIHPAVVPSRHKGIATHLYNKKFFIGELNVSKMQRVSFENNAVRFDVRTDKPDVCTFV